MAWTVSFLDERVEAEMEEQPKDIRARFDRMRQLIMEHGPAHLPPKYVKHISDGVWELRLTGRDGIARAFYVADRSEERRVGKECQSVCRSRWSPYH